MKNFSKYKLVRDQGHTVPNGFLTGELTVDETVDYLQKLGLYGEMMGYTIKGITVPRGFSLEYNNPDTGQSTTYPAGKYVPVTLDDNSWEGFLAYAQDKGKDLWTVNETGESGAEEDGAEQFRSQDIERQYSAQVTDALSQFQQDKDFSKLSEAFEKYREGMRQLHEEFKAQGRTLSLETTETLDYINKTGKLVESVKLDDAFKERVSRKEQSAINRQLKELVKSEKTQAESAAKSAIGSEKEFLKLPKAVQSREIKARLAETTTYTVATADNGELYLTNAPDDSLTAEQRLIKKIDAKPLLAAVTALNPDNDLFNEHVKIKGRAKFTKNPAELFFPTFTLTEEESREISNEVVRILNMSDAEASSTTKALILYDYLNKLKGAAIDAPQMASSPENVNEYIEAMTKLATDEGVSSAVTDLQGVSELQLRQAFADRGALVFRNYLGKHRIHPRSQAMNFLDERFRFINTAGQDVSAHHLDDSRDLQDLLFEFTPVPRRTTAEATAEVAEILAEVPVDKRDKLIADMSTFVVDHNFQFASSPDGSFRGIWEQVTQKDPRFGPPENKTEEELRQMFAKSFALVGGATGKNVMNGPSFQGQLGYAMADMIYRHNGWNGPPLLTEEFNKDEELKLFITRKVTGDETVTEPLPPSELRTMTGGGGFRRLGNMYFDDLFNSLKNVQTAVTQGSLILSDRSVAMIRGRAGHTESRTNVTYYSNFNNFYIKNFTGEEGADKMQAITSAEFNIRDEYGAFSSASASADEVESTLAAMWRVMPHTVKGSLNFTAGQVEEALQAYAGDRSALSEDDVENVVIAHQVLTRGEGTYSTHLKNNSEQALLHSKHKRRMGKVLTGELEDVARNMRFTYTPPAEAGPMGESHLKRIESVSKDLFGEGESSLIARSYRLRSIDNAADRAQAEAELQEEFRTTMTEKLTRTLVGVDSSVVDTIVSEYGRRFKAGCTRYRLKSENLGEAHAKRKEAYDASAYGSNFEFLTEMASLVSIMSINTPTAEGVNVTRTPPQGSKDRRGWGNMTSFEWTDAQGTFHKVGTSEAQNTGAVDFSHFQITSDNKLVFTPYEAKMYPDGQVIHAHIADTENANYNLATCIAAYHKEGRTINEIEFLESPQINYGFDGSLIQTDYSRVKMGETHVKDGMCFDGKHFVPVNPANRG